MLNSKQSTKSGPLSGLTVVDCTSVVMGPYATSLLSDLGATVIKVEPPQGDIGRRIGPMVSHKQSALSIRLLRNKKSVTLDLSGPSDQEQFQHIIARADAVVTNIRPSARERLGLDYDTLEEINPEIVLCTAQAFSATSERRDEPGYDDTIQAHSGMCHIYSMREGDMSLSPSLIADKVCGIYMALATVSALLARVSSGRGQWVDVPMVDNMVAFNLVEHLGAQTPDPPMGDFGWPRSLAKERRPHQARDGWVCVLPYTDSDWVRFLQVAGQHELVDAPEFSTSLARNDNPHLVQEVISKYVSQHTVAEVLKNCEAARIACAEARTLGSLIGDEYLASRGVLKRAQDPKVGTHWEVSLPFDFSSTPLNLKS